MTPPRTIVVSSRAMGPRLSVRVLVYDTLEAMRSAGEAYNGSDHHDTIGMTQARTDPTGRTVSVLVRLTRGHLSSEVVVHELHHASTALWGSMIRDSMAVRRRELTHYNEEAAHLHSQLVARLVDRLYAYGYYASP